MKKTRDAAEILRRRLAKRSELCHDALIGIKDPKGLMIYLRGIVKTAPTLQESKKLDYKTWVENVCAELEQFGIGGVK